MDTSSATNSALFFEHKLFQNELYIEISKRSFLEPETLYQLGHLKELVPNRALHVTGYGSIETYFAMGYFFTLWGAKQILFRQPGMEEISIKPAVSPPPEKKEWFKLKEDKIELLPSKGVTGKWPPEVLEQLHIPAELPEGPRTITITGRGAVSMYMALGVYTAQVGISAIRICKPQLPYAIEFSQEKIKRVIHSGTKTGVVVGILGDPNSGKSVFSSNLYTAIKLSLPAWYKVWRYDCDKASPTADWYTAHLSEETKKVRERLKLKWSPELHHIVIDDLTIAKTNLDLTIADMPGGDHKSTPSSPKRITGELRAEMMKCCDAFIILGKSGTPAYEGWKAALKEYNLDGRIIAHLESIHSDKFSLSDLTLTENNIFEGKIAGLNRDGDTNLMVKEMCRHMGALFKQLTYIDVARKAKAATVQAFLTGSGGTRYGAAARSAESGKIFTSGQYSSFNHSTNIHAEMSVLSQAALAGDPDIEVLAIASSNGKRAIPCGVCRQVMLEHCMRTGRDFDVVMLSEDGWFKTVKVSELLPNSWRSPSSHQSPLRPLSPHLTPDFFSDKQKIDGSYFLSQEEKSTTLKMVWDSNFTPNSIVVKTKYEIHEGGLKKTPHAFTEAPEYKKYIIDNKRNSPFYHGLEIHSQQEPLLIKNPIEVSQTSPVFGILNPIFSSTNLELNKDVKLSCSRMLGIHTEQSDYDLIVTAQPEQISRLRDILAQKLISKELTLPESSKSLQLLRDSFSKPKNTALQRMLTERRYVETFAQNDFRFSIMYSEATPTLAFFDEVRYAGRIQVAGQITDDSHAPYKRSVTILRTYEGNAIRIICYHKVGMLLKKGDEIAVCGHFYHRSNPKELPTLLLSNLATDKIVWLS